jgi:hypothetical protein
MLPDGVNVPDEDTGASTALLSKHTPLPLPVTTPPSRPLERPKFPEDVTLTAPALPVNVGDTFGKSERCIV